MKSDKNVKGYENPTLKTNVKKLLKKAKKLNFIKPLSSAFDNTPVDKEEHKGNIKSFN